MEKVINFELLDEYKIYVEFDDGANGIIDFKSKLQNDHRKVIRDLLKPQKFAAVKINLNTLSWDNGVDFAPDYLYKKMRVKKIA